MITIMTLCDLWDKKLFRAGLCATQMTQQWSAGHVFAFASCVQTTNSSKWASNDRFYLAGKYPFGGGTLVSNWSGTSCRLGTMDLDKTSSRVGINVITNTALGGCIFMARLPQREADVCVTVRWASQMIAPDVMKIDRLEREIWDKIYKGSCGEEITVYNIITFFPPFSRLAIIK